MLRPPGDAACHSLGPDRLINGQVLTAQASWRDDRALVDCIARELPDWQQSLSCQPLICVLPLCGESSVTEEQSAIHFDGANGVSCTFLPSAQESRMHSAQIETHLAAESDLA